LQLSCQTAAKQTLCVWNKLTYSTWSWQTTEELVVYRLADRLHSSWQSAAELTVCSWADRSCLIERVAAQLRVCIWAELTHCSQSWQITDELIVHNQADRLHLSGQIVAERKDCSRDSIVEVSWHHYSWQVAAQLTGCSWISYPLRNFSSGALTSKCWLLKVSKSCFSNLASPWKCSPAQLRRPCHTVRSVMTGSLIVGKSCICPTWCSLDDKFHLRWQGAAELTCCSWADMLQLSWQQTGQVAAELTDCIWANICQLSWQIASELTYDSWADCSRADRE